MTLLAASDATVLLGSKRVVDSVSFACNSPGIIGLVGPNGAGKTSLLRGLVGLLPLAAGMVVARGRRIDQMERRERAKFFGYLPQHPQLAWPLLCRDLVMLGRMPHRSGLSAPSAEDRRIVEDVMLTMDVLPFADRPISTLSGGERARVLIARAFAQEPVVLMADEPTDGLDPAHQISVMEQFRAVAATGRLVIITLHDLALGAGWCDRLLVLQNGRLVADGPPEAVLSPLLLRQVYGIEAARSNHQGRPIIVPVRLAPINKEPSHVQS